jgi:hypothetical protein
MKLSPYDNKPEEPKKEEKGQSEKQAEPQTKAPEKKAAKGKAGVKELKPSKSSLDPGCHPQIGYVNGHGVLFPVGLKYKGGHISSKGNVVLNVCPECKNLQYPSQAIKGYCDVVNEKKGCGFNKVAELEEVEL